MVNFPQGKSPLDVAAIFKAERQFYEAQAQCNLENMPGALDKLTQVEKDVKELRQEMQKYNKQMVDTLAKLEQKLNSLSVGGSSGQSSQAGQGDKSASTAKPSAGGSGQKSEPKKDDKKKAADDDDIDLFGSDDDEEEAEKNREERAKAALDKKKSGKPAIVAKSMITLDVKPWDDETDVKEMEKAVRTIEQDGLVWGTSKFVDVAFGIKKLQITCVVEDDKVGTDFLEERITGFEDLVQSVDIASFNKI